MNPHNKGKIEGRRSNTNSSASTVAREEKNKQSQEEKIKHNDRARSSRSRHANDRFQRHRQHVEAKLEEQVIWNDLVIPATNPSRTIAATTSATTTTKQKKKKQSSTSVTRGTQRTNAEPFVKHPPGHDEKHFQLDEKLSSQEEVWNDMIIPATTMATSASTSIFTNPTFDNSGNNVGYYKQKDKQGGEEKEEEQAIWDDMVHPDTNRWNVSAAAPSAVATSTGGNRASRKNKKKIRVREGHCNRQLQHQGQTQAPQRGQTQAPQRDDSNENVVHQTGAPRPTATPGAFAVRDGSMVQRHWESDDFSQLSGISIDILNNDNNEDEMMLAASVYARTNSGDAEQEEKPKCFLKQSNRYVELGVLATLLAVTIAAITIPLVHSNSSNTKSPPSNDRSPPPSPTTRLPCNFTGVEQPDPFLQCTCQNQISVISEKTKIRYHQLHEVFMKDTIPTFNETKTSCDPRNVALMWLATDPISASGDLTVTRNRYVLALLYALWEGDSWKRKDGWLSPEPECQWSGVQCMLTNLVKELRFSQNLLKGTIPKEIALLENLQVFDVSSNKLEGEIPEELYSITSLEQLVLWDNILTGTISERIQDLRELRIFYVSNNRFSGNLPKAMTDLRKMTYFIASANYFTGPIFDKLLAWPNIVVFNPDYNSFVGTIPSEIGQLSQLRNLDLSANEIDGTIPTEMGRATSLEFFKMDGHNLNGTIPTQVGDLANLAHFAIMLGNIEGTIPTEFGKLLFLQDFVIKNNGLTGTIPSELGLCNQLQNLDISSNAIEGTLPSELGQLMKLQMIKLDWTKVTGVAPSEICALREGELIIFEPPCHGDFECTSGCCTVGNSCRE